MSWFNAISQIAVNVGKEMGLIEVNEGVLKCANDMTFHDLKQGGENNFPENLRFCQAMEAGKAALSNVKLRGIIKPK